MNDEDKFWAEIDVRGPDECWPWLGKMFNGYGVTSFSGERFAHRVACELAHGPAPADRPFALHARHCTMRWCCNPAHLRWGTQTENMADKISTGSGRGHRHPNARLSDRQVMLIRSLRGCAPRRAIAKLFGVRKNYISEIFSGKKRSL